MRSLSRTRTFFAKKVPDDNDNSLKSGTERNDPSSPLCNSPFFSPPLLDLGLENMEMAYREEKFVPKEKISNCTLHD